MATKADLTIPLEPDSYYHIYNRGNNSQKTFFAADNYLYFLKKLDQYMSGYFYFYSYCLLPNHFHILIRVKENKHVLKQAVIDFKTMKGFQKKTPEYFVSERFRRFFLSYSKSINKQQNRNGSLFQKNFRRKQISTEKYFCELVRYIHLNPVIHKITDNFKNYKWSSYSRILQNRPSKLEKAEILGWFEDKANFEAYHDTKVIENDQIEDLILE